MKGAIFDLDGTILDSMAIWETYGTSYLRSKGCECESELDEMFRAFSLRDAAIYCKNVLKSEMTVEEVMADINKVAENFYFYQVPLKEGVKEYLENLKKDGVKLCIATATDRHMTEAALKRNGIYELFEFIMTCTEVGAGKKEPLIFRKALEKLGTSKEETVIFEDAIHAVETAKKDGFKVFVIYDKFEKHPEEIKALADKYMLRW